MSTVLDFSEETTPGILVDLSIFPMWKDGTPLNKEVSQTITIEQPLEDIPAQEESEQL